MSAETYALLDRYRRLDELAEQANSHYLGVLTLRAYRDFADSLSADRGESYRDSRRRLDLDFPLPVAAPAAEAAGGVAVSPVIDLDVTLPLLPGDKDE